MKKLSFAFLFFLAFTLIESAQAKELYGVKFDDKVAVDGKDLVLNGLGLRSVNRWGLKIKVYVIGLYLPQKSCVLNDILASKGPKYFRMVFHRNVDSEAIEEGWKEAFLKNCGSSCKEDREKLNQFNHLMSDMRTGKQILVTVYEDKVDVTVEGRRPAHGVINGKTFADVVQKIWLGTHPPNEELKQGLIGACPEKTPSEKTAPSK